MQNIFGSEVSKRKGKVKSKKVKVKKGRIKIARTAGFCFRVYFFLLPSFFCLLAEGIMGILEGKRAAIFGVANDRSIAWAISEAFHAEGAELAFTFAGEILEKRVRPLAEGIGAKINLPCDVTKDEEIEKVFTTLKQEWGGVDILIHAIAFANKEDLSNPYVQTSRQGFHLAMDVSAYSFVALVRHAAPLMEGRKASILTMTYMGAEKVIPNYNVMGVAKAALEASVRYLAHDLGAKGI